MEAVRKMVNGNKGFFSFWLVIFFLSAGTGRNFVYNAPSVYKTDTAHHHNSPKQILSAAAEEGQGTSLLDQLQDSDADDIEFTFFGNFSPKNIFTAYAASHEFAEFAPYNSIYRVPLYDLYCNWKFHLS